MVVFQTKMSSFSNWGIRCVTLAGGAARIHPVQQRENRRVVSLFIMNPPCNLLYHLVFSFGYIHAINFFSAKKIMRICYAIPIEVSMPYNITAINTKIVSFIED